MEFKSKYKEENMVGKHILKKSFCLFPTKIKDIDGYTVTIWLSSIYKLQKIISSYANTKGVLVNVKIVEHYISESSLNKIRKTPSIYLVSANEHERTIAEMIAAEEAK